MLSHCDSSFRELLRERLASLFVRDVKQDVIGQTSSSKLKDSDETPRGVFGGWLLDLCNL